MRAFVFGECSWGAAKVTSSSVGISTLSLTGASRDRTGGELMKVMGLFRGVSGLSLTEAFL